MTGLEMSRTSMSGRFASRHSNITNLFSVFVALEK